MSKIQLFDLNGDQHGETAVAANLIEATPHGQAMFDAILAERAALRQGTHSTLTKGEVRGGGRKPYRQKHTGRARQGSRRNPHFVGGGIAFGPKPTRNYTLKVNKKVAKLAFRSALSHKLSQQAVLGLVEDAHPKRYSTKALVYFLKQLKRAKNEKTLIVLSEPNVFFSKSSENMPTVQVKTYGAVSVQDLLHATLVIVQPKALEAWAKHSGREG